MLRCGGDALHALSWLAYFLSAPYRHSLLWLQITLYRTKHKLLLPNRKASRLSEILCPELSLQHIVRSRRKDVQRHDTRGNMPFRSFPLDRKSTRLNSSHANISYAVFCLKKKTLY